MYYSQLKEFQQGKPVTPDHEVDPVDSFIEWLTDELEEDNKKDD